MSTRNPPETPLPAELGVALAAAPSSGALATSAPTGAPTPGLAPGIIRVPTAPTLPDGDPLGLGQLMAKLANELFAAPPLAAPPAAAALDGEPGGLGGLGALGALGPVATDQPQDARPTAGASGPAPAPTGAMPAAPSASAGSAPPHAAAPVAAPPPAKAPAPASPSTTTSPFSAPLRFDGLTGLGPWLDASAAGPPPDPWGLPSSIPLLGALPAPSATELAPGPTEAPLGSAPHSLAPYWLEGAPDAEPVAPPPQAAPPAAQPAAPSGQAAPSAPPAPSAALAAAPGPIVEPALARPSTPTLFDPHALAREFPILRERVHGKRLVWLDNAATTQKPQAVIDRLAHFYSHENSNIHRAAHTLAARATEAYEQARNTVRRFLGAASTEEIVFVRGATEGINLVAQSWGRRNVGAGDEIVLTWLEHHANIVPWQQLAAERGARLRVAPVDDRGQILLDEYERLLGPRTRLVAMTQVSNALGTITPARTMIELAHRRGIPVLLDGAQAVSHLRVDVQALDCDFYVLSGHKVFAPTGIGVVYAKRALLEAMPPWQGGGNMIQDVTFERTSYQGPPARFEAGTGNIADAVGLGAALDWLTRVGIDTVAAYEHELTEYATARLATVPGLTMIGTAADKAGVLSFVLAGQDTTAVGGLLDREGIAVRSGHHCAQPILRRFGVEATVRASLAPYNTREDLDALVAALRDLQARR